MWDWAHFKEEGWVSHTKRSAKLALLLLLSGAAMVLHLLVPFWQQPRSLQRDVVACKLCEGLEELRE
jgi:hypothetical protein|tara:strand:+ start:235 stop:435 length:201 start_codon:yes stop_codon:yes gene_type:complete